MEVTVEVIKAIAAKIGERLDEIELPLPTQVELEELIARAVTESS